MSDALAISLHALAAETAGATGTTVDLGEAGDRTGSRIPTAARLTLATGAVTGTLTVVIETSPDQSTWRTVDTFSLVDADAHTTAPKTIGGLERYVRATWTVTGVGASIAWSLAGSAEVIYCEPADITRFALAKAALKKFLLAELLDACISATSSADDFLNGAFELPLTAWGESLRQHCAELAAGILLRSRGCDPANAADKPVFDAEARALAWFDRIMTGHLKPPEIIDTTPDEDGFEGGSYLVSNADRGWNE